MSPRYELRVAGHLDAHWAGRLGGLALRHDHDGASTLTGEVADQARLHGILTGLRDMGAELLSLRTLERSAEATDDPLPGGSWPRRTERLLLRPARAEDADATWRFRRLPLVSRWLTEVPSSREAWVATFTDPARLATTLVVERDGEVIGDLMLRVEDAWGQAEVADRARATQAELAWVLHPEHTGHGNATEAVRELLRTCFEDLGLRRVVATCFADNDASWRLMERVGMRRELHAVGDALHRSGEWLDTLGYALLAAEWRAANPAGVR